MRNTESRSRGTLEKGYWDKMAPRYDDEIFDSLLHDKSRVILDEIRKARTRGPRIADYGCGIGLYLPALARIFEQVAGFDSSRECVRIARERMRDKPAIRVNQASAAVRSGRGQYDVVLCVNVMLDPSRRARAGIVRTLRALLASKGRLILVVPAFESATLLAAAELAANGASGKVSWDVTTHSGGIVAIEGIPTKHHAKDELRQLVEDQRLRLRSIKKVEYSWQSHSLKASAAFRDKRPFDWIVVADAA